MWGVGLDQPGDFATGGVAEQPGPARYYKCVEHCAVVLSALGVKRQTRVSNKAVRAGNGRDLIARSFVTLLILESSVCERFQWPYQIDSSDTIISDNANSLRIHLLKGR